MTINLGVVSKVALVVGSIGTITGSGYLANEYFLKAKISTLLEKEEYTLLSKNKDEDQWKKRWKEYIDSSNNIWKLDNFSESSKNTQIVPENFKDLCVQHSTTRISNKSDENYKNVQKYCTKGFTISSLINEDKSIEVIADTQTQGEKWKGIWANYFKNVKDQDPLELGNLSNSKEGTVPDNYKTKCDAKKAEEVRNKKDKNYLTFKDWCTIPKAI